MDSTPATPTSSSSSAERLVSRVQDFVLENKNAILIGTAAAAVAIGGVAYYASSSKSPPPGDIEKGEKSGLKEKKKGKPKSGKKKKSVNDKDGPLLEERKTKSVAQTEDELAPLPQAEIDAMSIDDRSKMAASLKTDGNQCYKQRNFSKAAALYTRAIQVTPKPEPVFFSNRAACYVNMSPPKHELVVADCDEALKLDKMYVKALNRRAAALEALGRLQDALRDYTASTIIEKFGNKASADSLERVLKNLSESRTKEILSTREPRMPSLTFVSAYFAAFRPKAAPPMPSTPSTGDQTFQLALTAVEDADYPRLFSLVNQALEQGITGTESKAYGLNLRGTFKFLMGDSQAAEQDLKASIETLPSFTQSWVKIASVYMEQGKPKEAFDSFDEAIKHNPDDPDIYYHRGQVYFIMNEFGKAAENYIKSTSLHGDFVFTHIQLAVAQYKSDQLQSSMATFRRTLKQFPRRSEPQNYYGELLLDQGRFPDAVEKFDRAIELEKAGKPPINVLPMVNKGLTIFQWKQDHAAASQLCEEALQVDPECEAAVATLAQLALQQNKVERAVELFKQHSELARTEPELMNALNYQYASQAQMDFMNDYPELAPSLGMLAQSMT